MKERLADLGFREPTPIQTEIFRAFRTERHIVGIAPTGTGKTYAYLLPILEQIDRGLEAVQAIICVPTNELVEQVLGMLKAVEPDVSVRAYYGGFDQQREIARLKKRQPLIVIATPERLKELAVTKAALNLKHVKNVVLDEADMMFDRTFLGWIDEFDRTIKNARYLLFSASLSETMEPFIRSYFGSYLKVDTRKEHELRISYPLIDIRGTNRLEAIEGVVRAINPYLCFVFVSKKKDMPDVYERIQSLGEPAVMLSSDLSVRMRKQLIGRIRKLEFRYVVTSDLASRGIDLSVSHIINYDLPLKPEFFFHRSGRTGRMGQSGTVITLQAVEDQKRIESLRRKGVPFQRSRIVDSTIVPIKKRKDGFSDAQRQAIKRIAKPKRIKPNYRKKNRAVIEKAIRKARKKTHANHR
ncbi:MAG: DEAD/DEAH box helicase [Acholeplasmataceae bacterium]